MRHAEHDLLNPTGAGQLNQLIEQRYHAFPTLKREALLAYVFGVQVFLETFGCRETLEDHPTRRR